MAENWTPPKFTEIRVADLVKAMQGALEGHKEDLKDICRGINRPEWYSHIIRLYTPEHHLITPVKIGDTWSSLEIRVTEAEPVEDYSDEPSREDEDCTYCGYTTLNGVCQNPTFH